MKKKIVLGTCFLFLLVGCGETIPEDPFFINREGYDFIFSKINNKIRIDEIKDDKKNINHLVIPETIDSLPVTSIDSSAFTGASFQSVSFEGDSKIEIIEDYAFSDCLELTSIVIPSSVTHLGVGTFYNCLSLNDVKFNGESLHHISSTTFFGNESLSNITLPQSITSIGDETFMNCTNLEEVHIDSKIEEIGYYAFSNDTKVEVIFSEITDIPATFDEDWAYTENLHENGTNEITYSFKK